MRWRRPIAGGTLPSNAGRASVAAWFTRSQITRKPDEGAARSLAHSDGTDRKNCRSPKQDRSLGLGGDGGKRGKKEAREKACVQVGRGTAERGGDALLRLFQLLASHVFTRCAARDGTEPGFGG